MTTPPDVRTTGTSTPAFSLADFDAPELATFLQAHLDDLAPTAPAESRHALDLSGLQRPDVPFWAGHLEGRLVATGALATLDLSGGDSGEPAGRDEELKSMRTAPDLRGMGLGRALLRHLLDDARSRGVERLWLETGSMEFFVPARTLYATEGFVECPPFGSYAEDENSVFMTLSLA